MAGIKLKKALWRKRHYRFKLLCDLLTHFRSSFIVYVCPDCGYASPDSSYCLQKANNAVT